MPVRIRDWKEVYEEQELGQLQRQAGRCMDCGIPFCHSGCPLGNLIPEWNDLAWKGDWREAIERLHATNNFPEFTGRLCPAPCETACVLGINQPAVTIKQIEVTTIDRAFDAGYVQPQAPERLSGKTVAVVGSGPAGLAAAQQLTRAGHTVAVYERADKPGGLLRYGIPEFKMEKSVLDRRIAQMEAEGTRFRSGVDVGGDVTGKQLRDRYDAVVLAIGATVPRDLPVPGPRARRRHAGDGLPAAGQPGRARRGRRGPGHRRGQGRHRHRRRRHRRRLHRHLAPPGCALGHQPRDHAAAGGGARRAASRGRPTRCSSASPPRTRRAATACMPRRPRRSSARTARSSGIRVVDVRMGDKGFEEVEGTERVLPAQLILLAMGFLGPQGPGVVEQLEVELDERSNVKRDKDYMSSVPGVFVAGDAGRGQSLIVWAIAEGRSAAAGVDRFLTGAHRPAAPDQPERPPPRRLTHGAPRGIPGRVSAG